MTKLEILLDAETEQILENLASTHAGDRSVAIREALRLHGVLEGLLDDIENSQADDLRQQKKRSERGFREGRYTRWDDLKKKNRL